MEFETFICLLCAVPVVIYFFAYEINWHWVGFDRFRKKKGHK